MSRRENTPVIAAMLSLESADTPMHIGALLRFQTGQKSPQVLQAQIASTFRAQSEWIAPWHWRLRRSRLQRPRWQACRNVDLEHHFRQIGLPAPGGERELGVLVSRLHSQALDMRRPPWECYLIEGLEQGCFAIYLKVHRALVDAAGGAEILYAFLSDSVGERLPRAPWTCAIDSDQPDESSALWARPLSTAAGLGRALGRLVNAGLKKDSALALPYQAPRTALNGPVNRQRRFATQQYALARLQAVADVLESDINTVQLYLCGSALRRFLKEFNALPDKPLIAALPQSRASLSDFGLAFVSLGSDQAQPLVRFAAVKQSYQAAQQQLAAVPEPLRMAYSLTAGAPFMLGQFSGVQHWLPAMFNLFMINLPGPDEPRYLAGARLASIHTLSMLMPGTALSISCLRYADTLNIGLTGARDTLPHLQRIAVYMGQALEQLEAALQAEQKAG